MRNIAPCLWFDDNAEEAVNHYTSIFENSKIENVLRWGEGWGEHGAGKKGKVLAIDFTIEGRPFKAINGGPLFKFNEAVSFSVECKDQAEVDTFWDKLTADGGTPSQCGWLKDRFGLSWQIVPGRLMTLMADPDANKAARVTQAMLKMQKIDIAALEKAAA
ncbi:VOC family protein [Bradyrhizobium sp. LHD-71]|uniref:VOC family protein n=1 Tax=Bradyrhizobium sp. LHD-71 TaxID=3072141 RepID=UPI00280DBE47|nr:VOC family protein [Bradyrhizobium sp. LHD-71]MDQ8731142.1 VOC family protein [Bradyrhizobium sp. LHD-71]